MTTDRPHREHDRRAANATLTATVVLALMTACAPADAGTEPDPESITFTYEAASSPGPGVTDYHGAYNTADGFAHTWRRDDLPEQAWRDVLKTYTTPEQHDRFDTMQPGTGRALRGRLAPIRSDPGQVDFTVQLDAGTLVIHTRQADNRWVITNAAVVPSPTTSPPR
ncbi:hypothetical protein AB0M36_34830 [Actinoplanes sp. NPDC051346]|uniref:hypothetical protein n=1 Tax=Actinoplanes sp. NPDC051346 TaxID=3155048 RepID=UPI00343A2C06